MHNSTNSKMTHHQKQTITWSETLRHEQSSGLGLTTVTRHRLWHRRRGETEVGRAVHGRFLRDGGSTTSPSNQRAMKAGTAPRSGREGSAPPAPPGNRLEGPQFLLEPVSCSWSAAIRWFGNNVSPSGAVGRGFELGVRQREGDFWFVQLGVKKRK